MFYVMLSSACLTIANIKDLKLAKYSSNKNTANTCVIMSEKKHSFNVACIYFVI